MIVSDGMEMESTGGMLLDLVEAIVEFVKDRVVDLGTVD